MALAGIRLGDVTDHFTLSQQYRGTWNGTWQMRREVRQVTGRGEYFLRSDRDRFVKAGCDGGKNPYRPSDGPGGALRGKGATKPQVRIWYDAVSSSNINGAAVEEG